MSAARARGGQLVVENVALLSGGSGAFEAKYKVVLSDDSFRAPGNQKVAFPLLHFLLVHISPSDAASFKACFPVLDREQERDFRRLCDTKLADLERQKLLPGSGGMRKSTLAAAGGDKFEQLIWHLSTLALKQAALRHPAYGSSTNMVDPSPLPTPGNGNNELPGNSTSSSNRRYAALLRARIASERAAFARTTQMGRDSTARWTHEIEALKDRINTIANRTGTVKETLKSMGYDPDKDPSAAANGNSNMVLKTSPIESDGSFDDNDSYNTDLNGLLPFTGETGLGKEAEGIVNSLSNNKEKNTLGTIFNPSIPDSEAKSCANVAQLIEAAIESLENATKRMNQLGTNSEAPGDISDISRDTSLETVDTGDTTTPNNKLTEQARKSLSLHQAILESTNSLAETAKTAAQNSRSTNNGNMSIIEARKQQFEPKNNVEANNSNGSLPSPLLRTFDAAQDSRDITALARFTDANNDNNKRNINNNTIKSPPPPPTLAPSPQWITDATEEKTGHAEYNEETEAMSWELMDVDTDPDTTHIKEEEDIDITIPSIHSEPKADFLSTVHDLQKAQVAVNSAKKSSLRKTSRSNFDPDVPFHHVTAKSRRKKSGKMVRFAELPPSYTASKSAAASAASHSSAASSSSSAAAPSASSHSHAPTVSPPAPTGLVAAAVRILDDNLSSDGGNSNNNSPTIIRTGSVSNDNNGNSNVVPSTHILTRPSTVEEEDEEREREVLSKKNSNGSSIVVDDDAPLTRDEDYVSTGPKQAPVSNTRLLRVKQPQRRNTPRHLASRRAIVIRNAVSDRADSTVTNASKLKNGKKSFVVVPRRDKDKDKNDKESAKTTTNDAKDGVPKGRQHSTSGTIGVGNTTANTNSNRSKSIPAMKDDNKSASKVEMKKATVEPSKKEMLKLAKDRQKDMVPRKPTVIIMTNPQSSETSSSVSDESDLNSALNSAPDLGKLMKGGKDKSNDGTRASSSADNAGDNKSVVKVLSNELTPTSNSLPKKMKQRRHSMAHSNNSNKSGRSSRGLRKKDKKDKNAANAQVLPDRKMNMDPDSDVEEPQARRSISSPDYAPGERAQNNNGNSKRQASATGRLTSFTNMYGKHRKKNKGKNKDYNKNENESGDNNNGNSKDGSNSAGPSRRRASIAGEDGPMFSWLNSGDKRAHTHRGIKRGETFHGRACDDGGDIDDIGDAVVDDVERNNTNDVGIAIERAESGTEDPGQDLQRKNSSIFSGGRRSSVFSRNRDRDAGNAGNNSSLPFFRKDRDRNSAGAKPSRVKALRDRIAALL